jgi:ADP-ribosylglycohydrolase
MADTARLSKTLGALLGVHTGDSLGATLEFDSWDSIQSRYPTGLREIIGGGPFSWPAGHATDDTDLTRAVLLAYRDLQRSMTKEGKAFDVVKAAADYSIDWLTGNWPDREKGDTPDDIGSATYVGLSNYQTSRNPATSGAGPGSAGNGSLMRCIPTALFTATREKRIEESKAISAFTHNDVRCTVSCAAYNEIVAALVEGKSVDEAIEMAMQISEVLDCPSVAKAIERGQAISIKKFADKGPGRELPDKTSGYVLQSLTVAVAALLDPRGFEDVLVDVVRIGGDTDTNGAIAGGLLGARDGVEAIPERWLEVLQFREEFGELTREILKGKGVV